MKRIICAIAELVLVQAGGAETPTPAWPRHLIAERFVIQTAVAADFPGDGRPDVASASKDSPGGNWFAWWEQGKDPL
jgi:hypothetical protein